MRTRQNTAVQDRIAGSGVGEAMWAWLSLLTLMHVLGRVGAAGERVSPPRVRIAHAGESRVTSRLAGRERGDPIAERSSLAQNALMPVSARPTVS